MLFLQDDIIMAAKEVDPSCNPLDPLLQEKVSVRVNNIWA